MVNPIYKWIKRRIANNKNCIIVINGPTGSSKTYSALRIAVDLAEILGTPFTPEKNLDFNFTDMLRKTKLKDNQEPGTVFILEEVGSVGVGTAAREWQSKANRFFYSFMQTARYKRQVLIFTCPEFNALDAGARRLVHCQMETLHINYKAKLAYLKPFVLQVNPRSQKIYFKYLRFKTPVGSGKLSRLACKIPPTDIINEYEKMKAKFGQKIEDMILNADKPVEKTKYLRYIRQIIEKGLKEEKTIDEIGVDLGCDRTQVYKLMKDCGIDLKQMRNEIKSTQLIGNTLNLGGMPSI